MLQNELRDHVATFNPMDSIDRVGDISTFTEDPGTAAHAFERYMLCGSAVGAEELGDVRSGRNQT